jgi:hypothetical protein
MSINAEHDDLPAIAACDAWLDDVSRGVAVAGDPLAGALTQWLRELDDRYQEPAQPMPSPRLLSRKTAATAAAVAILLATAGTAAASPASPVHRILFGHDTSTSQSVGAGLRSVTRLLDAADRLIRNGQSQRYLGAADRASATDLLTRASTVLQGLPHTSDKTSLTARQKSLTVELSMLPGARPTARTTSTPTTTPPSTSQPGPPQQSPPNRGSTSERGGTGTDPSQSVGDGSSDPDEQASPGGQDTTDPEPNSGEQGGSPPDANQPTDSAPGQTPNPVPPSTGVDTHEPPTAAENGS